MVKFVWTSQNVLTIKVDHHGPHMDIKTATHALTQVMTPFLYKINVYMNRSLFMEILPSADD